MGFVLGQHLVYSSGVATDVQLGGKIKYIILPIQTDPNVLRFNRTQMFVLKAAAIITALVELTASSCASVCDGPKYFQQDQFATAACKQSNAPQHTNARNATTIRSLRWSRSSFLGM
jgi:hypothetical protein